MYDFEGKCRWFVILNYIAGNSYVKMGVSGVGSAKPMFVCAILGVSGGVQVHTWKSHMRKWVVVALYW